MKLLKDATPLDITTEDLLLIVESTGDQAPYEKRLNLRRRVISSLETFVSRCRRQTRRATVDQTSDPFGDLFMGFEGKHRPVLESIMNHHGLLVGQQTKPSSEQMREAIVSHIASAHCVRPIDKPPPWISQQTQTTFGSRRDNDGENVDQPVCDDFVHDAAL